MAGYSDIYRNIPNWAQEELDRRSDREYIQQTRSAWVRATSGFRKSPDGERKILMGGDISNNNSLQFGFNEQYEAEGSVPPKRPVPGITSIDITESERMAEGTIKWKAWSLDQLEDLQPFFMNPATTMFIEIGWSDMDPSVVVDPLASKEVIAPFYKSIGQGLAPEGEDSEPVESNSRNYKDHPRFQRMQDGKGKYYIFPGKISDFSFEMNQQGGFDCTTKVIALAESMYMLSMVNDNNPRVHLPNDQNPKNILEKLQDDLTFKNPEVTEPQSSSSESFAQAFENDTSSSSKSSNSKAQQKLAGDSDRTPKVKGGQNYPSSFKLGPNQYYSWGQVETIFNEAFQLSEGGNLNSTDRTWRLNSSDVQISYFRGKIASDSPNTLDNSSNFNSNTEEVGLKSTDLDVCLVNAGKKRLNMPPKFDRKENFFGNTLEQDNGGAGWLYHLYVSTRTLKNALNNESKYHEALLSILDECSKACHGIWDFALRVEHEHNTMQVIDRNHLFNRTVNDIKENDDNLYNFRVFTRGSQIRDFSLSSDLEDKFASMFAAKNLNQSNSTKPIKGSRSDVEGQFFQRFTGEDVVWKNLKNIQEKGNQEQSGEREEQKGEQQEKSTGLHQAFYSLYNVPKQTELENLRKKREEERADWEDAKFNSIFPDAWEILETERAINADDKESSAINANAAIKVDVSLTLNGITGLRRYQTFKVQHVPEFYRINGFFIIKSVRHSVQNNDWTTTVDGRFIVANMLKRNIKNES